MIIFFSEGRLGNQLFQYAFLKTIQKENERIVVFGFDEFLNVFDVFDDTLVNIPKKKYITRAYYKIIRPILYKTADLKIISKIQVKYEYFGQYRRESTEFSRYKGIFDKILLVKTAFFQSERFFNPKVIHNIRIKHIWEEKAVNFLKENGIIGKYKVFVHLRIRDYKNYYVFGVQTILPMNYYHGLIRWFLDNRQDVFFIFLSDEPEIIDKEFSYLKNKVISYNTYGVDFAIMTFCEGAILSPSSFSWWGSYFMKNRDIVFVPKYWLGWRSKIEYQKKPIASYMKEVDVNVL